MGTAGEFAPSCRAEREIGQRFPTKENTPLEASTQTQKFMDALAQLEQNRDDEPMRQLYTADCELWTLTHKEPLKGTDAITTFWKTYSDNFETITSEFVRVIESDNHAALEWQAKGTLRSNSEAITYWGVTLLDFGDGGITRFASYYDMKPFLEAAGIEQKI